MGYGTTHPQGCPTSCRSFYERHWVASEISRMLAGLGAALYASGSYDEAARRLCDVSDLTPADSGPIFFLGKMEKNSANAIALCRTEAGEICAR